MTRALVTRVTREEMARSPYRPVRQQRHSWFHLTLTVLSIVAVSCVATAWLAIGIGEGVIR